MVFKRLVRYLLTVHEYIEHAIASLAASIGANQNHRFVGRDLQFVAEPTVARLAPSAGLEVYRALFLAIEAVLLFGLIVADVDSIPRSQLDLLAARGSGSDFALMLFPLVRRIDLPVNGVALIEELIERCERNILRPTQSNCAKTQRRAGNRFHLRQHLFWVVSDE